MKKYSEMLLELIKERRSVRIFNGNKVPKEIIMKIIEAGIWAPTGCNNQELKFLVIENVKDLKKILEFKPFFKGVSTVLLVFYDMSLPRSHKMYVQRKTQSNLPYIDGGLALSNMILYAKSEGVDSCIFNLSEYHLKKIKYDNSVKRVIGFIKRRIGFHKSEKENFEYFIRHEMKIPNHLKIICGVSLGYAKIYPDIKRVRHGGDKVMRSEAKSYIIKVGND